MVINAIEIKIESWIEPHVFCRKNSLCLFRVNSDATSQCCHCKWNLCRNQQMESKQNRELQNNELKGSLINGLAPWSLSFLNANYQKFKHQGKKKWEISKWASFLWFTSILRDWSMLKQMLRRDQLQQLFLNSHAPFSCDDLRFFLLLANFECSNKKRSVQNEETAVWFKSMASHLGAIRVGMSWFDLQERCQTLFRTEYTVITPALQLPYSVVCGFLLWAHQCNSVPTIRHRLDGLLHTYARIRSANHPLLICMLTISTVLMREMRIPCAPALRCEEK